MFLPSGVSLRRAELCRSGERQRDRDRDRGRGRDRGTESCPAGLSRKPQNGDLCRPEFPGETLQLNFTENSRCPVPTADLVTQTTKTSPHSISLGGGWGRKDVFEDSLFSSPHPTSCTTVRVGDRRVGLGAGSPLTAQPRPAVQSFLGHSQPPGLELVT